jgi:hypothetical protein
VPRVGPGSALYLERHHRNAGSFGIKVRDLRGEYSGALGLAAAHTIGDLAMSYAATSNVWAPQPQFLPGGILDQHVGITSRSSTDAPAASIDAAVFQPLDDVELDNDVIHRRRIFRHLVGVRAVQPNSAPFLVHKAGAKTHITSGYLDPTPLSPTLNDRGALCTTTYGLGYAIYDDGAVFAAGGDSGAAVFDDDGYVVGLLVGMLGTAIADAVGPALPEPPRAFCVPIEVVLDELDVEFVP